MRQEMQLQQVRREEIRRDFQGQTAILQDLHRQVDQQNREARIRRDNERAKAAYEEQQEKLMEMEKRRLQQEDRRIDLEERRYQREYSDSYVPVTDCI